MPAGEGRHFCAGIDLGSLVEQMQQPAPDGQQGQGQEQQAVCEGRARWRLRRFIHELQASMTSLERCSCPVIAAIHGACIGAGIDLVTCADIRLATEDARMSVKEVDLAIVAGGRAWQG